jgi:ATP synthase protein I
MRLKVLLPTEVLLNEAVTKVIAEAENGSFCLLPRHIDFVAALVPGLLSFTIDEGHEEFLAIDEGILVKCGAEVLVSTKETRKMRARREQHHAIWFWLGMVGLVGWSVAIPTIIGIALGVWIDRTWPSRYSWTLMLLLLGMMVGCLNAWFWVRQESERD